MSRSVLIPAATCRKRVAKDLATPGLSRNKILATVVRLLGTTLIRVGNEEYARTNESFGLTTMRDRHVKVKGHCLRFEFRGKSGIRHAVDLTDRRLARIVKESQDLPGYELFQYIDDQGARRSIDSADVNACLQRIDGQESTAKDFRTWAGTVLAARALQECELSKSTAQASVMWSRRLKRWPNASAILKRSAENARCIRKSSMPIWKGHCSSRCASAWTMNWLAHAGNCLATNWPSWLAFTSG